MGVSFQVVIIFSNFTQQMFWWKHTRGNYNEFFSNQAIFQLLLPGYSFFCNRALACPSSVSGSPQAGD
jgi:hypothetical protein